MSLFNRVAASSLPVNFPSQTTFEGESLFVEEREKGKTPGIDLLSFTGLPVRPSLLIINRHEKTMKNA